MSHISVTVLLLIFALSSGIQAWRPKMEPDVNEYIINEGEPLEITCTSFMPMTFVYPRSDDNDDIVTSLSHETERYEDSLYKFEFRRSKTVHGDTGWYGCANRDVEIQSGDHDNPNVSWMYVYVTSNTSFFVQDEDDDLRTLLAVLSTDVVIPCRPTAPDLHVTLLDAYNDELEKRVSFDPRVGFTIEKVTLNDHGHVKCVISHDDLTQEVNYYLNVQRQENLRTPVIMEDSLRHVIRGQTLRVNCTLQVGTDINYILNWTAPHESNRSSTRLYQQEFSPSTKLGISELTIRNVTDDDEGEYECYVMTHFQTKKAKTYVYVRDSSEKFINLTFQDENTRYQRREGEKVQWVVHVDAHPRPTLSWINNNNQEIVATWKDPEKTKYAIKHTPDSTTLRINWLSILDKGNYTLQAINENEMKTINFTLDVLAKPVLIIRAEAYYTPGQKATIRCSVAANPAPNITWKFINYPYFPSFEQSVVEHLPEAKVIGDDTSFESVNSMVVKMSGHIVCTACNILGCDSTREVIQLSDVEGGFGIIEPKGKITEGDDVNLICAASVYNFTDSLRWYDSRNRVINETNRIKLITNATRYSHQLILNIKDVQHFDAQLYVCLGQAKDGYNEDAEYNLQVHDSQTPYFKLTNMNQTEIKFDMNTDEQKTVILKCFIEGMPKPKISWYKDTTPLSENEQYMFLHKNQELHIKYLLDRDSGTYTCRGENRLGSVQASQQIAVKGKEASKIWIIIVVVLVIICCILTIYFCIKIHRERAMRKELMEAGLMHFEEGALECLNPDLTVDDQAELLPYDKRYEFPRNKLKLGKQLGSGAFGVVMKAEAYGIVEGEEVTTVAVKMVRRSTEPAYIRALASELKIMVHLGRHLNVVNLLGACTNNITKRELLVIVEYCRYGNLHNYLLRHRSTFINQIDPESGKIDPSIGYELLSVPSALTDNNRVKYAALSFSRSHTTHSGHTNNDTETVIYCPGTESVSMSPDGYNNTGSSVQPEWTTNYRGDYKDQNLKPICTKDLLSWAFQVARGMEYLSQRKVLHGDLAARNILLAEDNVVKICDFGLAKTMYKDDNYKKKGDGLLPIKWMAIESIRDKVFSTQSDIWSFGIVLWEFFTLAKTPYPGMEAEKQYQKLIEGYRMEQPEYATKDVYDIMLQCWKAKPTLRPSFTELVDNIGNLLEDSVRAHYIDLNTPYMNMNTVSLDGKDDYLKMMSAPDHTLLSSPTHEYVNAPTVGSTTDETYLPMSPLSSKESTGSIPQANGEKSHFQFPSDNEDTSELAPMLNEEEDNYLKPINIHEKRAEFTRRCQAMKNNKADEPIEQNASYCNAPSNVRLIDLKNESKSETDGSKMPDDQILHKNKIKQFTPIIRTQDNYVNMPKRKNGLHQHLPDSFSNPSYIFMDNNRSVNPTKV